MSIRTSKYHNNSSLDFLAYLGIVLFVVFSIMLIAMGVIICIQYYHLFQRVF